MQAHGNATAYAFMLDADFVVKEPWRLRLTVQRMVAECRERSVEECGKGMKVLLPSPHLDVPWQSSIPSLAMTAPCCLTMVLLRTQPLVGKSLVVCNTRHPSRTCCAIV